jgi:prepilin signal peptidase PulO-like enzyme (type II secretory pathway)
VTIVLGALFFGLVGYVGVLLAGTVKAQPYDDGPAPAEPPVFLIIGVCAVIGAAFFRLQPADVVQTVICAVVLCALAAICCTDIRYGIVPDAFTLVPLGVILLLAIARQQPWPFLSAAVPFTPFAITAAISKGRGLGWGDVKLAALGGAVLGAEMALLAFAGSCLVAVGYAYIRGRRRQPIAFAPYLACAIGAALPIGTLR